MGFESVRPEVFICERSLQSGKYCRYLGGRGSGGRIENCVTRKHLILQHQPRLDSKCCLLLVLSLVMKTLRLFCPLGAKVAVVLVIVHAEISLGTSA